MQFLTTKFIEISAFLKSKTKINLPNCLQVKFFESLIRKYEDTSETQNRYFINIHLHLHEYLYIYYFIHVNIRQTTNRV